MMTEPIPFSLQPILSYGKLVNFVFSQRGLGKTEAVTDYVLGRFKTFKDKEGVIHPKHQFIWLKQNIKQLEPKQFSDIRTVRMRRKYPDLKIVQKEIVLNGEVAGYGLALRDYDNIKAAAPNYANVDTVVFDEFNINKSWNAPVERGEALLSIIDSLKRYNKHFRVICLANAIELENVYFHYLNIHINYKENFANPEFYNFKNLMYCIQICPANKYIKYKNNVKNDDEFDRSIANTPYGKMANENKFIDENTANIESKTQEAKPIISISDGIENITIWDDKKRQNVYVSDKEARTEQKITLDPDETIGASYFKYSREKFMSILEKAIKYNRLYYTNRSVRYSGTRILKKLGVL